MNSWILALALAAIAPIVSAQIITEQWNTTIASDKPKPDSATIFTWLDGETPLGPGASYTCKPGATTLTVREWREPLDRRGSRPPSTWKPMPGAHKVTKCLGFCKSLTRLVYETAEEDVGEAWEDTGYWKSEHPWGPKVRAAINVRLYQEGQFFDTPKEERAAHRARNRAIFKAFEQTCGLK